MIYLDTSALAKLLIREAESAALRRFLVRQADQTRISSAVVRTELARAAARGSADAADVVAALDDLELLRIDDELLDRAGRLQPVSLRSLDAIHLASALRARPLTAFVCYDRRLGEAATALGLPVAAPES